MPSLIGRLSRRRLVRARNLRSLRRLFFRPSGSAPDPHRLWLRGASAAQGFPDDRLCRGALRRRAEARRLRAGAAHQEFRNFDFLSPWEGTDYVLPGDEKAGDAARSLTMKATLKPGLDASPRPSACRKTRPCPILSGVARDSATMPKVFATGFMIVPDGMGLHRAAERASRSGRRQPRRCMSMFESIVAATPPGLTVTVDVGMHRRRRSRRDRRLRSRRMTASISSVRAVIERFDRGLG